MRLSPPVDQPTRRYDGPSSTAVAPLEALGHAACLVGVRSEVACANHAFVELFGSQRSAERLLTAIGPDGRRVLDDLLSQGAHDGRTQHELRVDAPPLCFDALLEAAALPLPEAAPAVLVTLRDASDGAVERRRSPAEHDRSRAILDGMREGYGLTREGCIIEVNEALCQMTGFSRERLLGTSAPFPFWPTDEHARLERLRAHVRSEGGGTHEAVFLRADGSHFEVEITITPLLDGHGRPDGYLTTVRDITDRKAIERVRWERSERIEALASITREVARAESRDAPRAVCQAALRVTGADVVCLWEADDQAFLRVAATVGGEAPTLRLGPEADHLALRRTFLEATGRFVPDTASVQVDTRLRSMHGARSVLYAPVLGALGSERAVGVLAFVWLRPTGAPTANVRERVDLLTQEASMAIGRLRAEEALRREAQTDPLTGLFNRRAFQERLEVEVDRSRSDDRALSLVMIDLDHFKAYNDANGHQAGDALLREATAAWSRRLREGDVLARWGGEEFCLLLPGCASSDAEVVVDQLRRATPSGQSFSAGIADARAERTSEQVVAAADAALYEAKRSGRARSVHADAARDS